jgi:hypothetical protein
MEKLVLLVMVLVLMMLSACGGGGSETFVETGYLALQDPVLSSGNYYDQQVVYSDGSGEIYVRMLANFDAFLMLFSPEVLNEPDTNNWGPYLLAFNDDIDANTTNSEIRLPSLATGNYVVVATSFFAGEIGPYQLTTNLQEVNLTATPSSYLQYRTFENPLDDHYRGWIDLQSSGAPIQAADVLGVQLFAPNWVELVPGIAPVFHSSVSTIAAWNETTAQFTNISAYAQSGLFLDLSDQTALAPGTWRFVVTPSFGGALSVDLVYPQDTLLTPIAASSMSAVWNPDGSLTLSWTEPVDGPDQYRVYLTDANGLEIFYGRVMPGTSTVTLSAALVQQIATNAGLSTPTVLWQMQTRSMSGSNNYARSMSNPVTITWP